MKRILISLLAVLAFQAHAQLPLREDTASQIVSVGPFLDPADGTAEGGLTIDAADVRLKVNGAADVAKNSGGCTHDVNGMYDCTFDATDTATAGRLNVTICETGAVCVRQNFQVLSQAIFDAAYLTGSVPNTPEDVALELFLGNTGETYATSVAGSVVKEITDNAGGSALTEAGIADAVWDEDATAHQTQGTFGQAIGDPVADTDTLYALSNTTLGRVGDPQDLGSGATLAFNLADIQAGAEAGLASIPDIQIEDQGGGVSLACALSVVLAYAAGDLATSGADSTYEDPSGTETRITGTVASAGNRTATISCPSL